MCLLVTTGGEFSPEFLVGHVVIVLGHSPQPCQLVLVGDPEEALGLVRPGDDLRVVGLGLQQRPQPLGDLVFGH